MKGLKMAFSYPGTKNSNKRTSELPTGSQRHSISDLRLVLSIKTKDLELLSRITDLPLYFDDPYILEERGDWTEIYKKET